MDRLDFKAPIWDILIDSFTTVKDCEFLPMRGRYGNQKVHYMRFPWWIVIGEHTIMDFWTTVKITLRYNNE